MIEINLVPDVKQELLKAQRLRAAVVSVSVIVSIAALAAVTILLIYVYGVQFGRNVYLDGQIKNKAAKLAKVEDLSSMVTIQNQLAKVTDLHANKNITSRIFDMLAASVPDGLNSVQVSQLDLDIEEKTVRIEGQTRGFDSMEVFKKTVANAQVDTGKEVVPLASNIDTSDISYGETADGSRVLRFVLSFTYTEELFSASYSGVGFKLSLDGNVTDSYLGIPRSIFAAPAKDIKEGE